MRTSLCALVLLPTWLLGQPAPGQDLRAQFGTRSAAAAEALDEGMQLVQAQKPAEAIPVLARALEADPDLQLTYYWTALAQRDQGEIKESLATYERLVAVARRTKISNVTIDACTKAGLMLSQLEEEDKAALWFTRAIVFDPGDENKMQWKAYRNMAVGQHLRGRNLAAALCALSGYYADPRNVERKMVMDLLSRAQKDEVARVLNFGDAPPQPTRRPLATKLSDPRRLPDISQEPSQLLTDMTCDSIVAVMRGSARYFLIDSRKENAVHAVDAPGEVASACLIGGQLFLSLKGMGLVQVEPTSGKPLREWKLTGAPPQSLAVLPAQGVAFFPDSNVLTVLDMDSGAITATDYYIDAVAADPAQKFCYCFKRAENRTEVGHVIIDGQPVMLQWQENEWTQTALLKFVIARKQPVLAELRMNAASNGRVLHVSPDGEWVGIAGGGGWRPGSDAGHGAGYGVAVFATKDLSHVQGFYSTDAYPQTLAINPATSQVAALREGDGKIFNLSKEHEPTAVTGRFGPAATWSRDGKHLYTADELGVRVFENEVAPEEVAAAVEMGKRFSQIPPAPRTPAPGPEIEPLTEYHTFAIKNDREATLSAIALALEQGRVDRPQEWLNYSPYQSSPALRSAFSAIVNKVDREGAGVRIYQLKKLKAEHTQHPGVDFLLGMSYFVAGQYEAAELALVAAVQTDQGRTNISTEAIRALAQIAKLTERPQAAAWCFAHLLRLDRNSDRVAEARPFFEEAEVLEQAQLLLVRPSHPAAGESRLPPLRTAAGETRLSAEELFLAAAAGVVLIRAEGAVGSGVCVQRGLILTNSHVVGSGRNPIHITFFEVKDDAVKQSETRSAAIVFRSEEEDLAVLRVAAPPESMTALTFEERPAAPGGRVYSVGHPALGDELLDLTITEGIISAVSRTVAGKRYLQHTAAVNPGNSGGPLLNEYGHVVGIATLRAELENVGFAIPSSRVQSFFSSPAGK